MLHGFRKPIDKYTGTVLSTRVKKKSAPSLGRKQSLQAEDDNHIRKEVRDER